MKLIINKLVYKNPCIDPLQGWWVEKRGFGQSLFTFLGEASSRPSIQIFSWFSNIPRIFWQMAIYLDILTPPSGLGRGGGPLNKHFDYWKGALVNFQSPQRNICRGAANTKCSKHFQQKTLIQMSSIPNLPREPLSELSLTQQVQCTIIVQCTSQAPSKKSLTFMTQMEPGKVVL